MNYNNRIHFINPEFKVIENFLKILQYFFSFFLIIIQRIISPLILIRVGELNSSRIGHLAANTELYLCEKAEGINRPKKTFVDLFCIKDSPICNKYLLDKYKVLLNIFPRWIIFPLIIINKKLPYSSKYLIGNNLNSDRDLLNLLEKYETNIKFDSEEEFEGEKQLELMGIPSKNRFVCLLVRDSLYLNDHIKNYDWSYHNYRDCDINNYKLVSEKLTKEGYFIIRMGIKAKPLFKTENKMIIDYANSKFRSDFLDVYLGAKCDFCISTSSGWDAIPYIFKKPIIYAPIIPLGYFFSFSTRFYGITKHHINKITNKELTFNEIFNSGAGFFMSSLDFKRNGIELIENSPEEIRDVVFEYLDKLNCKWEIEKNDRQLHERFQKLFPVNSKDKNGRPLHGNFLGNIGTKFLRQNIHLLK